MKTRVIMDTGPLVAFLNRKDRYHAWVGEQLAEIVPPLLTCEAVLSEACFLLRDIEGALVQFDIERNSLILNKIY